MSDGAKLIESLDNFVLYSLYRPPRAEKVEQVISPEDPQGCNVRSGSDEVKNLF